MRLIILMVLCFSMSVANGMNRLASAQQTGIQQPNIVFMMSDDQSWDGLSVAMHPDVRNSKSHIIETPNLENLAAQGMRFSAAYSPASVCSPTRLSLMNGRSPAANGWTKAGPSLSANANPKLLPPRNNKSISSSDATIAEILKKAGYATAHFGKWHLSGGGPGQHGFDVHDGNLGNEHAAKFADPNPVDIFGMCDRAETFMSTCQKSGKPFFVQLSWHALHAPENASRKNVAKYRQKTGNQRQISRMALATDLDEGVGRIMSALDDLDLAGTTYLIYTSDNGGGGGGGRAKALSGGKGSVWEGGIRVPLIIRGPGIAKNSWCHERVVGYDMYPTYCELAGIEKNPSSTLSQLEGGSIVQLLHQQGRGKVQRPSEGLVFHFPHYQSADGPHSAIIDGNLKLIHFYETGHSKLFDLDRDLGEERNLAESDVSTTKQLEKKLSQYLVSVNAQMPKPNPNYDPNQPTLGSAGKGGKQGRMQRGNNRRKKKTP